MDAFHSVEARMPGVLRRKYRSLQPGIVKICCLGAIIMTPLLALVSIACSPMWVKAILVSNQGALEVLHLRRTSNETLATSNIQSTLDTSVSIVSALPAVLVLTTTMGPIKITLRRDLSEGSVDYLRRLTDSELCEKCEFYRAEKTFLLQGIMESKSVPPNTILGACPKDAESIPNDCWSKNCGCHGPLMTRGAVGWAAGTAGGPDFFIVTSSKPVTHWGTQHTNFGFVHDKESLRIVDRILSLPTNKRGRITFLDDRLKFNLRLE